MTTRVLAGAAPLLLFIVGCDVLTAEGNSEMGILYVESEGAIDPSKSAGLMVGVPDPLQLPVLEAPDSVTTGSVFEITVRTLAPDSCWRADGATVKTALFDVEVIPYDREEGVNCADRAGRLPRTITLTAGDPGDMNLRVTGLVLTLLDGTVISERTQSIDHAIVVVAEVSSPGTAAREAPYSPLNAATGSSRAALRAGR